MIKCNSCELEKEEIEFPIRNEKGRIRKYRTICYDCKRIKQRINYKNYKQNNPFLARHTKMKASCKLRNIPYDLDEIYLKEIWTGFCPITGVQLIWSTENAQSILDNSAELDRFIPEKGYVKGNVTWICRKMNNLKSNGTNQDFKSLLYWMENWQPPAQKKIEITEKIKNKSSWNKGLKYENKEICGEQNPTSKLSVEQVKEIKQSFSNKRGEYIKFAKRYRVSPATIRKIVTNKTWKEV
jgi:hypothetical protein